MTFRPPDPSHAGLPLAAMPAVAIDTETTGLDVRHDRLVEVAAVRLPPDSPGGPAGPASFTSLVNPGRAIPASASAIHGIADADVAAAEAFPPVMAALSAWIGNAVVIGYAVGFDLAILRAEHERHGLPWRPPRSLCLRQLVQLIAPELPDPSLEMVASWLGVEPGQRHRALGDSVTGARIFCALLPHLRARGIVTLAQAERLCRGLANRRGPAAEAGWSDGVGDAPTAPASVAEYARLDSFPYRHRVAAVMRQPPVTLPAGRSLREALGLMMAQGISSVFVEPPPGSHGDYGILTEHDILRALDAGGGAVLDGPVADYASAPLVSVERDEFVYRALAGMARRGFRHLGVRDADGQLVGALSARDLLRQRAGDAFSLGDGLERAATPAELGRIWSGLTTVAQGLALEEVDPRDIAAIVSRELRALTRRAAELAEATLEREGRGAAPCPYALLVLGSGGRGESLLAMDQDNAIVFAAGAPGGPEDGWFARLGALVSDMLNDAGVAYCPGGVMASSPEWRLDLAGWRRRVGTWIGKERPEDLLDSDIFFDAVAVHGDGALADTLYAEALAGARASRTFLKTLALRAADFRVPLNWRGRPRLDNGRIDLKKGGIMPVFSAARVAALLHGITARSTPARLEALRAREAFDGVVIGRLLEAHRILLGAILRQQLRDLSAGIALSNRVAPAEMEPYEREQLTWALGQVDGARTLLGIPDF